MRRQLLSVLALPFDFEPVPYLQTSNGAYIVTDVTPSNTIGFEIEFMPFGEYTNQTDKYGCVMGGRLSSGNNDFQLGTYTTFTQTPGGGYAYYNGTFRFGSNTAGRNVDAHMIGQGIRQKAKFHNLVYTAPNNSETNINNYEWNENNLRPIYLFIMNNNGTPSQQGPGCRIYYVKFFNANTLIRDYVPVRQKSTNKLGMYEKITNQFLINAGSGIFTTA